MADTVINQKTSLAGEEVITRAIQFFSTEKWRATSQGSRAVTFAGRPPIPVIHIIFTILAFMACILPGVILYFLLIRKLMRFQNLVVTATTIEGGTDVSVTYPPHAKKLVDKFLSALPPTP